MAKRTTLFGKTHYPYFGTPWYLVTTLTWVPPIPSHHSYWVSSFYPATHVTRYPYPVTLLTGYQCSQMTYSKIRTNTVGKIRTDWKNSVLFFDMGIKLKDFVSTIEIKHTFLNLTISNYFININPIFKCNSIPYTHTVI